MKLLVLVSLIASLMLVGCSGDTVKPEDSVGSEMQKAGVTSQGGDSGKHAGSKKAEKPSEEDMKKGADSNAPKT